MPATDFAHRDEFGPATDNFPAPFSQFCKNPRRRET
jgi:hypothetical protein